MTYVTLWRMPVDTGLLTRLSSSFHLLFKSEVQAEFNKLAASIIKETYVGNDNDDDDDDITLDHVDVLSVYCYKKGNIITPNLPLINQ